MIGLRCDSSIRLAGARPGWLAPRGVMLGLLAFLLAAPAALPEDRAKSSRIEPAAPRAVTKTFSKNRKITIGLGSAPVQGDPYPSKLRVKDFNRGRITDVDLTLKNFSSEGPDDVDFLLVKSGVGVLVVSDAGGLDDVTNLTITLDDEASNQLPDTQRLQSGRFKPSAFNGAASGAEFTDEFPPPAPEGSFQTNLSAFDGLDPNGQWKLFVIDDFGVVEASSIGSWKLTITATVGGGATQEASAAAPTQPETARNSRGDHARAARMSDRQPQPARADGRERSHEDRAAPRRQSGDRKA